MPRWKYWLLTLFSVRGLFVLSPILLVGIVGLADALRRSARKIRPLGTPESGSALAALAVLGGVAFLVLFYSFKAGTNFGGSCFGFRWYISFTPLVAYYAARHYAGARESARFRTIFYALGLVSLLYALIGMQDPWLLMENNLHPAVRGLMFLRGF